MNYQHSRTCTGCPMCDREMAALMTMTTAEKVRWQKARDVKFGIRAACAPKDFAPPDTYAADVAARRAHNALTDPARTFPPAPRPTAPPKDFTPPDPYAADIDQMRRENR